MIGILSAAVLATLDPIGQIHKGRDAQRKSNLSQIQKALEQYYQDNGRYPASSSDYKIVRLNGSIAEWGEGWTPYMAQLPKDPLASASRRYIYDVGSNGQSYRLYAGLERGSKDSQVCQGTTNNQCSSVPPGVTCGGTSDICNYGATSPNTTP